MGIKRKLSSNTGASIVFALAIFLVSTIISLALISISVTSAKSSATQLDDEQAYLAVSSAARLFVSAIDDTELKARQNATAGAFQQTNYFEGATFYKGDDFDDPETLIELDNNLITYIKSGTSFSFTIESPNPNLKYDVVVTVRKVESTDLIEDIASPYVFIAEFKSKKKEGVVAKGSYRTSMCFYPNITQVKHYKVVTDGSSSKNEIDNRDTVVTWDIFKNATGEAKDDE